MAQKSRRDRYRPPLTSIHELSGASCRLSTEVLSNQGFLLSLVLAEASADLLIEQMFFVMCLDLSVLSVCFCLAKPVLSHWKAQSTITHNAVCLCNQHNREKGETGGDTGVEGGGSGVQSGD